MRPMYRDRRQAAQGLARALAGERGRSDLLVLGIARGGVPLAAEIARVLEAPLDVMVIQKLELPARPELVIGAVATGGVRVMNPIVEREIPPGVVEELTHQGLEELRRCEEVFRGDRGPIEMRGFRVILVDDGLATGATMRAAVRASRRLGAERVVVAVPVASPGAVANLRLEADEVICPWKPAGFLAIGQFYSDFRQVSDEEVRDLLDDQSQRRTR